MKKYLFVYAIFIILNSTNVNAQNYSISFIPDSLKDNANCVIRDYTKDIELNSVNSSTEKIKKVFTILNKNNEEDAYLFIHYDKNSKVNIQQIVIYDSNGKKVKKVKLSEVIDSPSFSEFELFSDNRTKFFKPNYAEYPYTIEYDYEISYSNQISYGVWRPSFDYNISIEHAKLSLTFPETIKINKKEINFSHNFKEEKKDNLIFDIWELTNIKAIEEEPFDVSILERTTSIYLMPTELKYDNYFGYANNWKEYGSWIENLYKGRDELSDNEKIKINALIQNIPDTLNQIKTLYKFMQDNTRYVDVTLGIGGYQPFPANLVFEKGYGDCKALSNYMYSMLKYIGVKSYPALCSSGRNIENIYKDFPNFLQFDHVIECIPYHDDTIWLECTNQKIPFGFLGDNTDDRDVLLLTNNGGEFAHTKKYIADDNIRTCNAIFILDSTGTANCSLSTIYKSLQYDDNFNLLCSNNDEQKKWLYKYTKLPSPQIISFKINNNDFIVPYATINENIISKNYCSFSGKYMIMPLNLINSQRPIQKMLKARQSDIIIDRSYTDYDTLNFQLPQNYISESIPVGKSIHSIYGDYDYSISLNNNNICYTRKFIINQGRYRPSDYKDLYDFILSVSKADNVKLLLTKKV
jgi:hypothetical protein